MPYMHGIEIKENPTSVPTPVQNPSGIPIFFGTAPVNQIANPAGALNKPVICNSFAEAKAAFGYSNNYKAFTLCQVMDAFFKAFRVAPIILVNVLDFSLAAAKDTLSYTGTVANGQLTVSGDPIVSGMTVKKGNDALTLNTDYTYEFNNDGSLLISFLGDTVDDGDSITVTGNKVKSSVAKCGVTDAQIVGSYTANTGVATGLELLRTLYSRFGRFPSIIGAPGFTSETVGIALSEKCEDISGVFTCDCVIDLPASTAPTVDAINAVRAVYTSPHAALCYPKVKYTGNGIAMDYSAMYAASLIAKDVADGDGAPALRVSNNELPISATVLEDGTEVFLDIKLANEINGIGVVTALNRSVWVSWGNNSAAYPLTTDPKDRWFGVRRFFTWWGNSFIDNYFSKVDDPGNPRLIESIVDTENIRGNFFVASQKCAGMRMEFNKEDNDVNNLIDGKFTFRMYLAPFTPAEQIINILEFDPTMLVEAFENMAGGESA